MGRMLASLTWGRPYTVTVIEGESWSAHGTVYGEYEVLFLGLFRDESLLTNMAPTKVTLNGKPAVA